METVLITGGKGIVGKRLSSLLQEKGYKVFILTRHPTNDNEYHWDLTKGKIDPKALKNIDHIIHVAGENIAHRWNSKTKQEILRSRVETGNMIFNELLYLSARPKTFISASGIGFYGYTDPSYSFSESDESGDGYLAKVCKQWELMADRFEDIDIRVVKLRTGLVLSQEGGFLKKIVPFIKRGLGSVQGTGRQYIPWIHIDDLCDIYLKSIEDNSLRGSYNAVSEEAITNEELVSVLADHFKKKIRLPKIPSFFLRLVLGEMSDLILLGNRISNKKIRDAGYNFKFTKFREAISDLFPN